MALTSSEISVRYRRRNPDRYKASYIKSNKKRKAARREWYLAHREYLSKQQKEKVRAYKLEMIDAYGGCCACCGEQYQEFLTLDHINGGGRADRKRAGSTTQIIRELKRKGWPKKDHRVLCMNCNLAFGRFGYCPHNKSKKGKKK